MACSRLVRLICNVYYLHSNVSTAGETRASLLLCLGSSQSNSRDMADPVGSKCDNPTARALL